ncbi:hypothetical protein ACK3SF_02675 [Candidatus Nanosalina sp. VS9-1]|uniref:hypothetical protein n=1 Tax=Candidatus Nanosalina sp. VS9-1 TaxID=3388566 RepID=UPI0039E0A486
MEALSTLLDSFKRASLKLLATFGMVFAFIGVFYVKQETRFLNFIPDDPVVFVIAVMIVLEIVTFSVLAYDRL